MNHVLQIPQLYKRLPTEIWVQIQGQLIDLDYWALKTTSLPTYLFLKLRVETTVAEDTLYYEDTIIDRRYDFLNMPRRSWSSAAGCWCEDIEDYGILNQEKFLPRKYMASQVCSELQHFQ